MTGMLTVIDVLIAPTLITEVLPNQSTAAAAAAAAVAAENVVHGPQQHKQGILHAQNHINVVLIIPTCRAVTCTISHTGEMAAQLGS